MTGADPKKSLCESHIIFRKFYRDLLGKTKHRQWNTFNQQKTGNSNREKNAIKILIGHRVRRINRRAERKH
jgi:hypothetical protein